MKKLVVTLAAGLAAAVFAVVPACAGDPTLAPCTNIPAGGCPLSYGVACEDPTCLAAYACDQTNNTWTLDHTCPPIDAGPDVYDAAEAAVDAADAFVPKDASFDLPPGASGGAGCEDLEVPDCTLAFGVACPMGCCDCEDLYVCDNGGWDHWGVCTGDGVITQDK